MPVLPIGKTGIFHMREKEDNYEKENKTRNFRIPDL
jgi:hypothetical protein